MSLLQSDFSRHSLLNLLGPAELRVFVMSLAWKSLDYSSCRPMNNDVLR